MGNKELQALSLDYARGTLSTSDYRQQREKIIDEATGIKEINSNVPVSAIAEKTSGNIFLKASIISFAIVVALILVYKTI